MQCLLTDMYADEPFLDFVVAEDLLAHAMQDISLPDVLTAMLYHKGFTALTTYRLMHWLWRNDRHNLARYLQSICSEVGFGLPRGQLPVFGSRRYLDLIFSDISR